MATKPIAQHKAFASTTKQVATAMLWKDAVVSCPKVAHVNLAMVVPAQRTAKQPPSPVSPRPQPEQVALPMAAPHLHAPPATPVPTVFAKKIVNTMRIAPKAHIVTKITFVKVKTSLPVKPIWPVVLINIATFLAVNAPITQTRQAVLETTPVRLSMLTPANLQRTARGSHLQKSALPMHRARGWQTTVRVGPPAGHTMEIKPHARQHRVVLIREAIAILTAQHMRMKHPVQPAQPAPIRMLVIANLFQETARTNSLLAKHVKAARNAKVEIVHRLKMDKCAAPLNLVAVTVIPIS